MTDFQEQILFYKRHYRPKFFKSHRKNNKNNNELEGSAKTAQQFEQAG